MSIGATGSRRAPTKRRADQAGQAEAENGQRQARADLIGGKAQHHHGEEDRHERSGEHPAPTPSRVELKVTAAAKLHAAPIGHHALERRD